MNGGPQDRTLHIRIVFINKTAGVKKLAISEICVQSFVFEAVPAARLRGVRV